MSTEKNTDTATRKKYSASTRPAIVDALSGKSGIPVHISAPASSFDKSVLSERLILRQARDERRVEGPVLSERLILRQAQDERRVEGRVLSERLFLRQARDERRVEGPVLSERLFLRQARDERRVEGLRTGGLAGSWCAGRTGRVRSW